MFSSLIRTATRGAVLASVMVLSLSAWAGNLVVSGDSNLGNAFNGSNGAPSGDNGVFFSNLLGGGSRVLFQDTTNTDPSEVNSAAGIKSFYAGLAGVSLGSISAPVTSAQLSGVSLFIAFLPQTAFSADSVLAIKNFLAGGGSVLLTTEYVGFNPQSITNGNALLSGLGSSISLTSESLDLGFRTATGSQIVANSLTAGVNSFVYAATTGTLGGSSLFKTTGGATWMASESFTAAVPEPSTYVLMFAGLLAIGAVARRRSR